MNPTNPAPAPKPLRIAPMKHPAPPVVPPDYAKSLADFQNHQRVANCLADIATHGKRQHEELSKLIGPDGSYLGADLVAARNALAAVAMMVNTLSPGAIP